MLLLSVCWIEAGGAQESRWTGTTVTFLQLTVTEVALFSAEIWLTFTDVTSFIHVSAVKGILKGMLFGRLQCWNLRKSDANSLRWIFLVEKLCFGVTDMHEFLGLVLKRSIISFFLSTSYRREILRGEQCVQG